MVFKQLEYMTRYYNVLSVFEISAIWLRAGPTRSENSSGPGRLGPKILPGRAGPIPKKQVWRKMTPKLVKNTLNWLQNPPKLGKGLWS